MKTWHRVVVLVVVAIVSLSLSWFYFYPFFALKYGVVDVDNISVNVDNIFKDVLNTTLTFLAVAITLLGVVMYALVSASLDKKVKTKISEEINLAAAKFYMQLSGVYWTAYEIKGEFQDEKRSDLEIAIQQSQNALKKINFLDEKKYERDICRAKNNLAYHLAARQEPDDARSAIPLITYAYKRIWKYDYYELSWKFAETYAFVLIRLGNQKQEGQKIIKNILKRRDLPTQIEEYIKQKYSGTNLSLGKSWNR